MIPIYGCSIKAGDRRIAGEHNNWTKLDLGHLTANSHAGFWTQLPG